MSILENNFKFSSLCTSHVSYECIYTCGVAHTHTQYQSRTNSDLSTKPTRT